MVPKKELLSIFRTKQTNVVLKNFLYSGWIDDEEGEPITRLNRRLEAITGLSTARGHSEALQVIIKPRCIDIILQNTENRQFNGQSVQRDTRALSARGTRSTKNKRRKIFALCPAKLQDLFLSSVTKGRLLLFSVVQKSCSKNTQHAC